MSSPPCKQAGGHLPMVVSTSQANLSRLLDFSPRKTKDRTDNPTPLGSSSVHSQLTQIAHPPARVPAAYVAQTQPMPAETVRGGMEFNAATTSSLPPISLATARHRVRLGILAILGIIPCSGSVFCIAILIRMPAETGTKTPKNCILRVLLIQM